MKRPIRHIILLAAMVVVWSLTATLSAPARSARQVSAPAAVSTGETGAATRVAHRGGGLLQFSRTAYRVRETDRHATIRVERLGSLSGTVTVAYTTSPGTALAGLNYQAAAGTLTFAPGVKAQRFTVPVLADGQVTGNKTVFLTLSAPAGGARLGPQRRAVLTIVNTDVTLTGTAAAGAPLASRLIKIKDKNGARRTGTTDSGGQFSVAVTGLAPTFLVKVEPPGVSGLAGPVGQAVVLGRAGPPVATPLGLGSRAVLTPVTVLDPQTTPLFSVGTAEAGVVNVHPFTDLIIRTWYEVQGTTVESVFDAPTTDPPAPSAEQVAVIASLVKDMLNIFLVAQGLDPITFDLIATPFDADGTGFDAVLEAAALEVNALTQTTTVTLTNATTSVTQATALTIVNQILKASTTTTGAGGASSGSITSAVVPTDPAVQAALSGVLTSLQSFAAVVNSKGNLLTATDLLPFFDANFLDHGFAGPFLGAAFLATDVRGQTLNSFRANSIVSYDDTNKVLCVITEDEHEDCFHKQTDGSWRFFGDQQQENVSVEAQLENRSVDPLCTDCNGIFKRLLLHVDSPEGTVSGASVAGTDGLTATLPKNPSIFISTVSPTPTTTVDVRRESFDNSLDASATVANFPPVGTVYTFTVTPISGPPRTSTQTLRATTVEPIAITNLAGHAMADANLGQPLTVQWTLPTTFPIAEVYVFGSVNVEALNEQGQAESFFCNAEGNTPHLTTASTSTTVTLPTTCGGHPVVSRPFGGQHADPASISVFVIGVHGENTLAYWAFH